MEQKSIELVRAKLVLTDFYNQDDPFPIQKFIKLHWISERVALKFADKYAVHCCICSHNYIYTVFVNFKDRSSSYRRDN